MEDDDILLEDDDIFGNDSSPPVDRSFGLGLGIMADMMRADCYKDGENVERKIVNADETYRRYSRAALTAYEQYRHLKLAPIILQNHIKDKMADADGHKNYDAAVNCQPELEAVYERYSFAAVFAIQRYSQKIEASTPN